MNKIVLPAHAPVYETTVVILKRARYRSLIMHRGLFAVLIHVVEKKHS